MAHEPALADALNKSGIDAQWVRPLGSNDLQPGEVVIELRSSASSPLRGTVVAELSRTLQLRRSELERHLIELIE